VYEGIKPKTNYFEPDGSFLLEYEIDNLVCKGVRKWAV